MKRIKIAVASLCASFACLAAAEPAAVGPPALSLPVPQPTQARIEVTAEQRAALGITVGRAAPRTLVPSADLPGRVVLPNDRVHVVTARSEGVLLQASVAVGELVSADQQLARVASPDFVASQRRYLEALSRRDLARLTAERESLLARDGVIAGHRALDSAAALRDAEARVAEASQSLLLSGMREREIAALERTRRLEPDLVLRAPFDAAVLEQFAEAGERLPAGGAVYRLGDAAARLVEIHAPLEIVRSLAVGARFQLREEGAMGVVIAVGSAVHSADQGVVVRGRLDPGAPALRPGQFVSVALETSSDRGSAWAVPATALIHAGDRAWIFERVDGGFAAAPVEIVGGSGRERIVVGALDADTQLALRGTATLKALWLATGGPR